MAVDFEKLVSGNFTIDQIQENIDIVITEISEELNLLDPDEIRLLKEEAEKALADAIIATAAANAASGKADAAQATADAIKVEYVKDVSASGNNIVVKHEDDTTTSIPIITSETQSDWNETNTGAADYIQNKPTTITAAERLAIGNNTTGITARKVTDASVTSGILTLNKTDGNITFAGGENNVIETVTVSAPLVRVVNGKTTNIAIPAASSNANGYLAASRFNELAVIESEYVKDVAFNNLTYEVTVKDQSNTELSFVALPEPTVEEAGKVLQINAAGDQWILVSASAAAGAARELPCFSYLGIGDTYLTRTLYATNNELRTRSYNNATNVYTNEITTATDSIFPIRVYNAATNTYTNNNIPLE